MANAKQCDICGKYFTLPDVNDSVLYKAVGGKVELYKLDPRLHHATTRAGLYFDACDDCVQEITDHILTKQADWKCKEKQPLSADSRKNHLLL